MYYKFSKYTCWEAFPDWLLDALMQGTLRVCPLNKQVCHLSYENFTIFLHIYLMLLNDDNEHQASGYINIYPIIINLTLKEKGSNKVLTSSAPKRI